jgi:hypothetical protein
MSKSFEIIKTPASGHPRAVFFTRSDGHWPDEPWLAIAAYEKGYAVVELGDEVVMRGWQEVRLSEDKAIARVREAGIWRERCFFVLNCQIGEILPDTVVLGEEFPLSEEADSWRIVPAMSLLAFRTPDMDKDKSLKNLAFSSVFLRQADQGGGLDVVLRPHDVYGWVLVWCRLLPGGRILRQTLPLWGTKQRAEIGRDVVAILTEPEQTAPSCSRAYSVGWGWNTAHLIAEDVRALGFSSGWLSSGGMGGGMGSGFGIFGRRVGGGLFQKRSSRLFPETLPRSFWDRGMSPGDGSAGFRQTSGGWPSPPRAGS